MSGHGRALPTLQMGSSPESSAVAACRCVRCDLARAFSLLAAFASPVFMCAAIAGWLYGVWPANPLRSRSPAFAVISGPLLGIYHVATADARRRRGAEAVVRQVAAVARPAPRPSTLRRGPRPRLPQLARQPTTRRSSAASASAAPRSTSAR